MPKTPHERSRRWSTTRAGIKMLVCALPLVLLLLIPKTPGAQQLKLTPLYTFTGCADGAKPNSGLIADSAGNLYGTTTLGGDACYLNGNGVVFKLDPSGQETVLHTFNGSDGSQPHMSLIRDSAGNLYGTTAYGGNLHGNVFKLDPAGNETDLYDFKGGTDGSEPFTGVMADGQGNLYGVTEFGGDTHDDGVVFKIDPAGNETILHRFTNEADGSNPIGLTMGSDGNLYGTTESGHTTFGGVFKMDLSGQLTPLYDFSGGSDGAIPVAGVIRDSVGNLYGTTSGGGQFFFDKGYGVVYKLDSAGNETVLHTFYNFADGQGPKSTLVRDAAGNLYGTTPQGGTTGVLPCFFGCGVVFKVGASGGQESVLYTFQGGTDGAFPNAGLLASQGYLYGTAEGGGSRQGSCGTYRSGCGVVFRLSLP